MSNDQIRTIDMANPEFFTKAIELALAASDATAWGPMNSEHVRNLAEQTSNREEQFVTYKTIDGEDWITSVTGNGEKSAANAEFYACSRAVVLGLVDEIDRLKTKLRLLEAKP